MGRFSKDKGKRGERELAGELTRVPGIAARRGVQFQGSPDSPDVITELPDIHIECKRNERFQLYKALEQAIADAGNDKISIVCRSAKKTTLQSTVGRCHSTERPSSIYYHPFTS
jgi:hypothetical protein